jgi:nucleotide-binding universal stress UspA family protein
VPSYTALKVASDIAVKFEAELCVLHVMEPLEPAMGVVSKKEFDAARSADAAHLIQQAANIHVAPCVRRRALVDSDDPAPGILRASEQEQVDLIVIATHALTGWRHFVLGSVAEAVVRMAMQPVLTVRRGPESPVAPDPMYHNNHESKNL